MREILFRGLTTKDEFVYGSLVITTHFIRHKPKSHTKNWIVSSAFGNGGWFNVLGRNFVREETVGQYTGFHDKTGIKIFEGDIVKDIDYEDNIIIGYVRYTLGSFYVEWNTYPPSLLSIGENSQEIIGNIYKNKELVKDFR